VVLPPPGPATRLAARPAEQAQNPTTSFLTATTLIYAIGAGITAAAGPAYRATSFFSLRPLGPLGVKQTVFFFPSPPY
jgi:hypothetical protein